MIRIFTRQIEKLRSQDGQALVFVAMVGLLIFLFFAMTMNLAELVQLKIKNQNTADAAAISAAVWQARALNTVSALNQNLLNWWVVFPITGLSLVLTLQACGVFCCAWQCPQNPACIGCWFFVAFELLIMMWSAVTALSTGELQDDVLSSFDDAFVIEDVTSVVDLNYNFKPNARTEDIDTELYMYLNENDGNLFLEGAGGPGTDFLVERGGWCELIVGILYNYCRRGLIPGGCSTGFWTTGMRDVYHQIAANPAGPGGIDLWYSAGGICEGSNFAKTPWAPYPDLAHLFPYVLRTFRDTPPGPYDAVNPEDAMPITTAVYREKWPPVMHMWGPELRRNLDCEAVPDDVFPCTDQGHFSFATAHAYSRSVAEFYWHFYGTGPWTMGYVTSYPVPLVPSITDWEARLFPLEPGLEAGETSTYGGANAYNDLAAQADVTLGGGAGNFLLDNVLTGAAPPHDHFLLY